MIGLQIALLTPAEVGRMYRKRSSYVRSLCRLGKLKCVIRSGKGPTGLVTLIDPASAAKVLGIP